MPEMCIRDSREKSGYPERENHHEKHEEFKKTIQELYEYLQDYEGPTAVSYTHLDVYKRQSLDRCLGVFTLLRFLARRMRTFSSE